jgi:hypothetical protein
MMAFLPTVDRVSAGRVAIATGEKYISSFRSVQVMKILDSIASGYAVALAGDGTIWSRPVP